MNIFTLISWVASFIYFVLSVYSFSLNPKSRLNRMSAVLCFSLAIVSLIYVIASLHTAGASAIFWKDFYIASSSLLSPVGLHYMLVFAKRSNFLSKWYLVFLLYLPGVLLSIFIINKPLLFSKITPINTFIFYLPIVLIHFIYATLSFYLLLQHRKNNTYLKEKKQSNILLLTGSICMILVVINIILTATWGEERFSYIPHVPVLCIALGILYNIVKYHFLKISSLISAEAVLQEVNDLIIIVDDTDQILEVNYRAYELLKYDEPELISKNINDYIEDGVKYNLSFISFINNLIPEFIQLNFISKLNEIIPVRIRWSIIHDPFHEPVGILLIGEDLRAYQQLEREIIERKNTEQKLQFLVWHDSLTGLYNRTFFEHELQHLTAAKKHPFSLILCDMDGLKLVNDSLGHDEGDKMLTLVSTAINDAISGIGIAARIGGDEFAVILPDCDEEKVKIYANLIRKSVHHNFTNEPKFPVSISLGYSTATDEQKNIQHIFKEADNYMYREKLNHGQSAKNALVQTLAKALEARDFITNGHTERIHDLVIEIAESIGLADSEISSIRLLARFHDIGKIGIPDNILFKPGSLTPDELVIMRRHSEIGYRIAQASADLIPIADLILKHHEWWNGNGYPLKLKGTAIPIQDRIIAIADAYDAMTNDRPYRKALPHEMALAEILKNSGQQFDPELVEVFIQLKKGDNTQPKKYIPDK